MSSDLAACKNLGFEQNANKWALEYADKDYIYHPVQNSSTREYNINIRI